MGHDGAQAVDAKPVTILPVGTPYPFQAGQFTNVRSDSVIKNGGPPSGAHSDIVHPEVGWIVASAAGIVQ
jgi:hypothetical protein